MSLKAMNDLRETLCAELDEIAMKPEMSAGDLEAAHKLTDTIKNIDKIMMLNEDGYSQSGDWEARGNFGRGSSYANRGKHRVRAHYSYDGNGDHNMDRSGRVRNGGGYSREGACDYMINQLHDMMDDAQSDKEREAIRRCISQLENA